MPKAELDLKQIERIINRLPAQKQIALVRRLEQKTWGQRFRGLVAKIDKRRRKYPISQKEINQLVKEARQERYAAGRS